MKNEQRSILQDWVMALGLRFQGTLVSAVRGADGVSKDDPIKLLTRSYRDAVLVAFDTKPSSFIDKVSNEVVENRMKMVLDSFDQHNWHYLSHLLNAVEILGYYHPDMDTQLQWNWFYNKMVKKMHLRAETKEELEKRLCSDEETFKHHED